MQPYSTEAPREWPAIFIDGPQLVLAHGKVPPKICMKCGATKDVEHEHRTLRVVSQGQQAMGMVGGAVGASIAATFRDDPKMGILAGTVIAGVGGGAIVLFHRKAPSADVEVALCEVCRTKVTSWAAARRIAIIGILGGIGLAALGALAGVGPLIAIGALVFVGTCILAIATKPALGSFWMHRMTDTHAWIAGVTPPALAAIHERLSAPKPKKRKKMAKPIDPAAALEPESPDAA